MRKICLKTERVSTVEEWKVKIPGFFAVVWYGSPFPQTLLGNTDEHAPPIQWVEKHRKKEVGAFVAVSADEREGLGQNKTTDSKRNSGPLPIYSFYSLSILFWIPRLLPRRWMPMVWAYTRYIRACILGYFSRAGIHEYFLVSCVITVH